MFLQPQEHLVCFDKVSPGDVSAWKVLKPQSFSMSFFLFELHIPFNGKEICVLWAASYQELQKVLEGTKEYFPQVSETLQCVQHSVRLLRKMKMSEPQLWLLSSFQNIRGFDPSTPMVPHMDSCKVAT
jgi:hypothetical protein